MPSGVDVLVPTILPQHIRTPEYLHYASAVLYPCALSRATVGGGGSGGGVPMFCPHVVGKTVLCFYHGDFRWPTPLSYVPKECLKNISSTPSTVGNLGQFVLFLSCFTEQLGNISPPPFSWMTWCSRSDRLRVIRCALAGDRKIRVRFSSQPNSPCVSGGLNRF